VDETDRACSTNGENRIAYRIVVRKPEGKRPVGRPRLRRSIILKWIREIGRSGMDWIELAQDADQRRAVVNTVMSLRVAYNFGKFLNSCTTGGFSRRAQLHVVS
jgi:hypothetical protein